MLPVALRCSCKPAQIASRSRSRSREQPARAPRCARARASNQHVTPVALRFSCKPDEQIARAERSRSREEHVTVHDHRETNPKIPHRVANTRVRGGSSVPLLHTHGAGRLHTVTADAPSSEPLLSNNQREALPPRREPSSCTTRHLDSRK